MICFEPGTVYDVAHLREFDLELAKARHPLATAGGVAVRCFRQQGEKDFAYDWWAYVNKWLATEAPEHILPFNLRLAPLAVKDGRPLHVGDEIEQHFVSTLLTEDQYFWRRVKIMSHEMARTLGHWRWPESKA